MVIRLGPVPPINMSNEMPRMIILLTRCVIRGNWVTAIQLAGVDSTCQKGATIALTDQHPELVHHRQIPVLQPRSAWKVLDAEDIPE